MPRIAVVLWNGSLGGAETFTADLCRTFVELGAEVSIVFVGNSSPLAERLDTATIPHVSLDLGRGRDVIGHPKRLARLVQQLGPDGALLPRAGYLTASLRAGGYRGHVVAVAHDALFVLGPVSFAQRLRWHVDRASGFWAGDVEVAVSDFALDYMQDHLHGRRLIRVYNGVDLDRYRGDGAATGICTIGCAGRLIPGKGIDVLIQALASGLASEGVRLRIAGTGPTQPQLERLVRSLGVVDAVEFAGSVTDMASFWRGCHIGAQPSAAFIESFGMSAVEAMACARPVVVTANGALPEVVEDGVTGTVVPPGDVEALAAALRSFTRDEDARRAAGVSARARCEALFDVRACAERYLALLARS